MIAPALSSPDVHVVTLALRIITVVAMSFQPSNQQQVQPYPADNNHLSFAFYIEAMANKKKQMELLEKDKARRNIKKAAAKAGQKGSGNNNNNNNNNSGNNANISNNDDIASGLKPQDILNPNQNPFTGPAGLPHAEAVVSSVPMVPILIHEKIGMNTGAGVEYVYTSDASSSSAATATSSSTSSVSGTSGKDGANGGSKKTAASSIASSFSGSSSSSSSSKAVNARNSKADRVIPAGESPRSRYQEDFREAMYLWLTKSKHTAAYLTASDVDLLPAEERTPHYLQTKKAATAIAVQAAMTKKGKTVLELLTIAYLRHKGSDIYKFPPALPTQNQNSNNNSNNKAVADPNDPNNELQNSINNVLSNMQNSSESKYNHLFGLGHGPNSPNFPSVTFVFKRALASCISALGGQHWFDIFAFHIPAAMSGIPAPSQTLVMISDLLPYWLAPNTLSHREVSLVTKTQMLRIERPEVRYLQMGALLNVDLIDLQAVNATYLPVLCDPMMSSNTQFHRDDNDDDDDDDDDDEGSSIIIPAPPSFAIDPNAHLTPIAIATNGQPIC
jgi:hypothetical protein